MTTSPRPVVRATHPSGCVVVGPTLATLRIDGQLLDATLALPSGFTADTLPSELPLSAPGWRIVELTDQAVLTTGQPDPDEARHLSVEPLPTYGPRRDGVPYHEVRLADADATRQRPLWLTPDACDALAVRLVQVAAAARALDAELTPVQ